MNMKKYLAVAVILLFISVSVIPSTGRVFTDDTTPPVTTHTLDPLEPDGDNGWYVSDVNVTLNATDDMSGVKEIRYHVNGAPGNISGSYGTFTITYDGDDMLVEYWAIDNVGNIEPKKSFTIDVDKTKPVIDHDGVHMDAYQKEPPFGDWYARFWTNATDATSGMDRVEMYFNYLLHEVNTTPNGACYEFIIRWSNAFATVTLRWEHYDVAGNMVEDQILADWHVSNEYVIGLICNPMVVNQSVTFFAIILKYFLHYPHGWHTAMFEHFTIPNDYKGYIGRYFICVRL